MNLGALSEPIPGELPAGEACQSEIQSQNFLLMRDYLVERAIQKGRERAADEKGLPDSEARNLAALREDGRRRLSTFEEILKGAMKVSTVNPEQVSKALRERATALLTNRGKDLRLVPLLGAACTQSDGLSGYSGALKLALALLQTYPKDLFPLPDDDDPADVWQRVNAVSELVSGDGMHALLGSVVIVDARRAGRLTLADLVGGLHDGIPVTEVGQADLDMALGEIGPELVLRVQASLQEIEATMEGLVQSFSSGTLPVPRLAETFRRAAARIATFINVRSGASAEDQPEPDRVATSASPVGATVGGVLRTREDARRSIQDVIRFVEKIEPGHPAPLLLKRADRLLGMSFVDIIRDMAPNALSDIERIVGSVAE